MFNHPQTTLFTGVTSGIGLELTTQLIAKGGHLIVVARNEERLAQLRTAYKESISCYRYDLSSRQQVEKLCEMVAANYPGLSIIINNAAIQETPQFLDDDFNFNAIELETRINLLAPAWITSLLLPLLRKQDGRCSIVNISSGLALAPKTNSAIYCATKAAIHSLSQSLRYQLEGSNIDVIEAVLPLVDTPMTAGRGNNKLSADETARQIIDGIQKRRDEIYVGKAKWLPLLMRLAPGRVKKMLKGY